MSEFLVTLLRIAYLAILWIFILFVTNVIRTDIYGHRVPRNAAVKAAELAGVSLPQYQPACRSFRGVELAPLFR